MQRSFKWHIEHRVVLAPISRSVAVRAEGTILPNGVTFCTAVMACMAVPP